MEGDNYAIANCERRFGDRVSRGARRATKFGGELCYMSIARATLVIVQCEVPYAAVN